MQTWKIQFGNINLLKDLSFQDNAKKRLQKRFYGNTTIKAHRKTRSFTPPYGKFSIPNQRSANASPEYCTPHPHPEPVKQLSKDVEGNGKDKIMAPHLRKNLRSMLSRLATASVRTPGFRSGWKHSLGNTSRDMSIYDWTSGRLCKLRTVACLPAITARYAGWIGLTLK